MIIDQLPSVGTPSLSDETVTEQGQNLFKVTWQRLLALFKANTTTSELTNDAGFVNASGASAAAPVQSVNGMTGAVTIPSASLSDDNPQPLGTATPGTSTNVSRADHVHAMPTADEVGAMSKWELLWTNASPRSNFAAQNIIFDGSYDMYICFVLYATTVDWLKSMVFLNGHGVVLDGTVGQYNQVSTRNADWIAGGGLSVSQGYSGNTQATNDVVIPYRIYGIKGVQTA